MAATEQGTSGVSGRYASALFDLAAETKSVGPTANALNTFQTMIDDSDDLRRLLASPVFRAEDQLLALEQLAAKAKLNGIALNFLKVMASNRRLAAVPAAIAAFNRLVAQAKGEVTAEVTSAEELSARQVTDLRTALKATIGSDVVLAQKIDPGILGGLIVKVGSRMMDNSLRTKLNSLKVAMKGTA